MDVSPRLESRVSVRSWELSYDLSSSLHQLAAAAREQVIEEFGRKALPTNHPLTIHVRRIVTQILEANNLGHLKSSGRPVSVRDPEDLWDPDAGFGAGRTEDVQPGVGGTEWELMVVNDDKVVNAMASYGSCSLHVMHIWNVMQTLPQVILWSLPGFCQ